MLSARSGSDWDGELVGGQHRETRELAAIRRPARQPGKVVERAFRLRESHPPEHERGLGRRLGGRVEAQHEIRDAADAARAQHAVTETSVDEAAHLLTALLQFQIQELRRRQLRGPPVAHAARQVAALHRAGGRQVQVARRSAQDAQGVDQAAMEIVGAAHLLRFRGIENALTGERLQRLVYARRTQRGMGVAVAHLQHLYRILDGPPARRR